jgi:ABC-type lipoprotein release transport system permease subunit
LGALLYGVHPSDPLTLSIVSFALLGAATLATYAPARRAARIDPVDALRAD